MTPLGAIGTRSNRQVTPRGVLVLSLALALFAACQRDTGAARAKAEFARGEAAFRKKSYDVAVDAYKKAIALDPAYLDAHDRFIFVSRSFLGGKDPAAAVTRLDTLYQDWIRQHPKQAAFYWGLGEVNYYRDPARCEQYTRKALQLDPKLAKAWSTLSLIAETKGDAKGALENMRRAAEADPDDPSYAFYYSRAVVLKDRAAGVALSLDVVKRFPASERAAQSLYWLGADAETEAQKVEYLERLHREFPPAKFRWSDNGMDTLVDVYASSAPEKAVALAREMVRDKPDDKGWRDVLALQEALVKARTLIASRRGKEALSILDPLKPSRRSAAAVLVPLLQAEADASAGGVQNVRKAYDRLMTRVSAMPDEASTAALNGYGRLLGKTPSRVDDDLWAHRVERATPAAPFRLPTYDGRTLSLSDYKGRVVLLNFWYPG